MSSNQGPLKCCLTKLSNGTAPSGRDRRVRFHDLFRGVRVYSVLTDAAQSSKFTSRLLGQTRTARFRINLDYALQVHMQTVEANTRPTLTIYSIPKELALPIARLRNHAEQSSLRKLLSLIDAQ